jgi:hypothetical protein
LFSDKRLSGAHWYNPRRIVDARGFVAGDMVLGKWLVPWLFAPYPDGLPISPFLFDSSNVWW